MAELIYNEFVRYSVGSKEVWIPPSEPHYRDIVFNPEDCRIEICRLMDVKDYHEWREKWEAEMQTWRTYDAGCT